MSNVSDYFLQPISKFLGKPMKPGYAAELEAEFGHLSPEALAEAARKIQPHLTGVPPLKTLQKALRNIDTALKAPVRSGIDPWDIDARIKADWLRRREACVRCKCNLGRRADKEGWLPAMIDFTMDHGRIPEGSEIERCIGKSRMSEDGLHAAKGSPFYNSLVVLRLNMLERASMDVFGTEAIKRTQDTATVQGQQGRRAGSSYGERMAAEERLQALASDGAQFALSPQAASKMGLTRRERHWSTEDVDSPNR